MIIFGVSIFYAVVKFQLFDLQLIIRNGLINGISAGLIFSVLVCIIFVPYFLYGVEAEVLLMTKNNVDGIYSADPHKSPHAKKFDKITHLEALNLRLQVMDATALSLCLENRLPIVVFDLQAPEGIERAVSGEPIGILVSSE